MGCKLSKISRTVRSIRIATKLWIRSAVRGDRRDNMVDHVEVLVERLKLGSLKEKIRRVQLCEKDILDNQSEYSELTSNLDVLSGIGTTGDARTLQDDNVAADSVGVGDISSGEEEENMVGADPPPIEGENYPEVTTPSSNRTGIVGRMKQMRFSIVRKPSLHGQFMGKLRGDYKYVDLFGYKVDRKTQRASSRILFIHALDCHQACMDLKVKYDSLLESIQQDGLTRGHNRRQTREKRKADIDFSALSPGVIFKGQINIPPQNSSEESLDLPNQYRNLHPELHNVDLNVERPYELSITREAVDELGQKYWIGRHQTYAGKRDKQSVIIIKRRESCDIYFEDYETHCYGTIEENQGVMVGEVEQLKRGEPGFFVQKLGADYNFELKRTKDSEAKQVVEMRFRYCLARSARALAFAAWCGSVSGSTVSNQKFNGYNLDWSEIMEDMVWLCDEVGNTMRRYVLILNKLRFKNPMERKNQMEVLGSQGIKREKVHEMWDAANILLHNLKSNIPISSAHNAVNMKAVNNFADKVIARLDPTYTRFDKSLRKAENRVCSEIKESWLQVVESTDSPVIGEEPLLVSSRNSISIVSAEYEDPTCTICNENFVVGDEIYRTPCGHSFHVKCLDEWFEHSSLCPVCRKDFSQTESI